MTGGLRDTSLDDRSDPAVRMVEHDPRWATQAALECQRILDAVGGRGSHVEHVGSTAVAGLVAKPIIDLQLSVASLGDVATFAPALEQLGYTYVEDPGSPAYLLFVRPWARPRTHHLHVCLVGSADEVRHVAVRDYLRSSEAEARAYGELKVDLVRRAPADRLAYIDGKDAYVRALEARALAWRASNQGECA